MNASTRPQRVVAANPLLTSPILPTLLRPALPSVGAMFAFGVVTAVAVHVARCGK